MKVGILTYHWVSNMGANLQALSTYKYLENHGYNPVIINWIPSDLKQYYINNVPSVQVTAHEKFAQEQFLSITNVCETDEEIAREIERCGIDYIVVGSDAVFSIKPFLSRIYFGRKGIKYLKPCSDGRFPNPFWGSFKKLLKKPVKIVSLSASAQNSPYTKMTARERKQYYAALEGFYKITVRDIWTKEMVSNITNGNKNPSITPDPVFAFNNNVKPESLCYVEKSLGFKDKYVLLSVSSSTDDAEWILKLESLFNQKGIQVVGLPKTNRPFKSPLKYNLSLPISPLEWYDAIKYSSGYIGELMHPVLVSLHNAVPVFVFDTYGFKTAGRLDEKSSKTFQIMSRFGLLDNYYNRLYNEFPTPECVFNAIMSFDSKSVKETAAEMHNEYLTMMNYILR